MRKTVLRAYEAELGLNGARRKPLIRYAGGEG
jgi:hypothetical protein